MGPKSSWAFVAVGDATCDRAPLQVGQFESAAKEMDQWLTWSFLEGGGGFVAHGQMTDAKQLVVGGLGDGFDGRHERSDRRPVRVDHGRRHL